MRTLSHRATPPPARSILAGRQQSFWFAGAQAPPYDGPVSKRGIRAAMKMNIDESFLATSDFVPAAAGVALAIFLVVLDSATWIELNVATVYSLPLVFIAASRRPRLLWSLALGLVAATFAIYHAQVPLAQPNARAADAGLVFRANPHLVDRSLAALTILLTAAILQGWLFSLRALAARDRALLENNERLASANLELLRHEEEITRQNAELERRRKELEAVSRRKTQLLASISHDIRTPIQAMSLIAEVIRRSARTPASGERMAASAQRLQSQALAVAELLSEVIDLASFDAGEVVLHSSEFALDALLEEVAQRMAPMAAAKGLHLDVVPAAEPLVLRSDRAKLGRVLGNLVSNAIKFTAQGGVTLSVELDPNDYVCIRVDDTGCGIPAASLERIFGEFCQEDTAAARSGSGWGLGLAICRRLTRLLGGELLVASQPGVGSTFTVVLPTGTSVGDAPERPRELPGRQEG
jgi:signal transduction histidine kinase